MNSPPMLSSLMALVFFTSFVHAEQWPAPIKMLETKGARVVSAFDAPDGLRGYALEYQGESMTVYLTPDANHVVMGRLLDADGKDLSEEPLERLVYAPLAKEMWGKLAQSAWIPDGNPKAPRILYIFVDPNCPYCAAFWKLTRPWINAGKVQLRHIEVGMLSNDSPGKAAALLADKNPEQALDLHEAAGKTSTLKPLSPIPDQSRRQLGANRELMHLLGASTTPTIFYLSETGRLKQHEGAPTPEQLESILGPL